MDFSSLERMETHTHSDYSNIRILDSINKIDKLIQTSYDIGLKGMVLTDHECLSGSVKLLKTEEELKKKEKISNDFKCGIGNEIYLVNTRTPQQKYYHFILIAKDTVGFHQLCELSSTSWYSSYMARGLVRVPTLKTELAVVVQKNPGHLIATSACIGGQVGQTIMNILENESKDEDLAITYQKNLDDFIDYCLNLFGNDFYLETAPGLSRDQLQVNKFLKTYAKKHKIKLIYGTDAHYLRESDRYAHKAYLNSKEGDREIDDFYRYAHLMTNEEAYSNLSRVFSDEEFIGMCKASMEIYDKIGTYNIFHNPIIPETEVVIKHDIPKMDCKYERLCQLESSNNIQERYWLSETVSSLQSKNLMNDKYLSRLNEEADILSTISSKLDNCLFSYFNTFQHYIDLFWECGSIVGPGRGSAPSFLSNYLLNITQLDPVQWNLAEWRFLNRERVELPSLLLILGSIKNVNLA